jgi:hypothetical protein
LKGADTVGGDAFGAAVAISGATVVVGSFGHASATGRAYIYTQSGEGDWRQSEELVGSGTRTYDAFGQTVGISGAVIVVGSVVHASFAARVFVFKRGPHGWGPSSMLGSFGVVVNGNSGVWAGISDETIAIGCSGQASHAGRVDVLSLSSRRPAVTG